MGFIETFNFKQPKNGISNKAGDKNAGKTSSLLSDFSYASHLCTASLQKNRHENMHVNRPRCASPCVVSYTICDITELIKR